jgi:hypothetical protein
MNLWHGLQTLLKTCLRVRRGLGRQHYGSSESSGLVSRRPASLSDAVPDVFYDDVLHPDSGGIPGRCRKSSVVRGQLLD